MEFLVRDCKADISIVNSQFESAIKIMQQEIIARKKNPSQDQMSILTFLLENGQLQINKSLDIIKKLDPGQSDLPALAKSANFLSCDKRINSF